MHVRPCNPIFHYLVTSIVLTVSQICLNFDSCSVFSVFPKTVRQTKTVWELLVLEPGQKLELSWSCHYSSGLVAGCTGSQSQWLLWEIFLCSDEIIEIFNTINSIRPGGNCIRWLDSQWTHHRTFLTERSASQSTYCWRLQLQKYQLAGWLAG